MYIKCPMTRLMKNYHLFTFWWLKSISPTLTNMSTSILRMYVYTCNTCTDYTPILHVHALKKGITCVLDMYYMLNELHM